MVAAEDNLPSFSFLANAPPGSPLSYQALQTRRKIAEEMLGRRLPFPKGIGEGLTFLGQSLANRRMLDQLDVAEQAQATAEGKIHSGAPPAETYTPYGAVPAAEEGGYNVIDAQADKPPIGGDNDPRGLEPYIRERAAAHGVDPDIAMRVAQSEGLRTPVGDAGKSHGAFQLYTGGGLGNEFTRDTGLNPADPANEKATIDYALRRAAAGGWGPWVGARKLGITGMQGIGVQAGPPTGRNALAVADNAPAATGELPTAPPSDVATRAAFDPASGSGLLPEAGGNAAFDPTRPSGVLVDEGRNAIARDIVGPEPATTGQAIQPAGNPPIATDIKPAPPRSILQEQIPPASEQVMAHPGPQPLPPEPLGATKMMNYWRPFIDNPNVSEATSKRAKFEWEQSNNLRKEEEVRRQEAFKNVRERWEKKIDEYDKHVMTKADRNIKQLGDRVGIAKTFAELDKMNYDAGLPRLQEAEKNRLAIAIQEQQFTAGKSPEVMSIGDMRYQWDQATGKYKDITPNVDPSSISPTEAEGKTLKFFERATLANAQLRKSDQILTSFKDTAAGGVPAIGNYLVSPEYQRLNSAREAWGQAVLRDESGAVLSIPEVRKKLRDYFPVPGDDNRTIIDKQVRRAYEERSLLDALGKARPIAERFLRQREERKVSGGGPDGEVQENKRTGKRRVNIGGYWEDLP